MTKDNKIDDFSDSDKVESNMTFWNPKEEKEVIGYFSRWEDDAYGSHAVIKTADNEELHLPNLTALNGKLRSAEVIDGNKIKLVSLGEKKAEKTGRMYQDFELFVKKE